MSLYREVGRSPRAIALAAIAALLFGLLGGFALGRGTASEPSLAEQVEAVGEEVRPALNALELVGIEYPQAVVGSGAEASAETELQGAVAQAESARDTLASASDLAALDPEGYRGALAATERVGELIDDRAAAPIVTSRAEEAAALIREAARLEPSG